MNEMCSTLINMCILSIAQTIPWGRPPDKTIPGWNEHVKSYQERYHCPCIGFGSIIVNQ